MINEDFFEIYKRLDINYTNKQVNSCSSINLKKDNVNQEIISRENQPPENDGFKRENDGVYLDINFNSNSASLQPCIAIKEQSFRLPIFELTHDFQIPNVTYQVKQNSRLYEEIYSLIYSKYSNIIINDEAIPSRKVKISETEPIFETSDKGRSYSVFWDGDDIKFNSSILLGEITGLLYNYEKKYCNKFSFDLPNISNEELNVILDASHYSNEFVFLKHCRLPFPFDDQRIRPNTQLQWLFIDKWPHLVVLTIPGVEIKHGDELVVDFGDNYHMFYVDDLKTTFKDLISINAKNTQIFHICSVCRLELEKDIFECKKCIICHERVHEKCGYINENSICCIVCLRNSFNVIFGINNKFNNPINERNNLCKDSLINILKIFDGNACEECLSLFCKKNSDLERRKSTFFCKLIHEFYHIDKNPDNIDSFYAEYNSKCETESKSSINLEIKSIENFYNIFDKLIKHLKGVWEENRLHESFRFESCFFQDSYVSFLNHESKFLFPDRLIYETWEKSKWRDFINWDKKKNCWVGILRPNGIFSRFNCNKHPTLIEGFYEAEKWIEHRINETTIPKDLISTILHSYDRSSLLNNESDHSNNSENNISHSYYHSPYLPTDLASHPDYKIFSNENESNKYHNNLVAISDRNSFSLNDDQLLNNKHRDVHVIPNTERQSLSYPNSTEFMLNDFRPRISSTGYIQCSLINKKRRIRSTLPLTSNAAKCPTEWRVRGITWHAERKAFIVPYRRDKDGGLTSTTFGAMKYGSPLTAFLKALEFRENYLKEQSAKLTEEVKQPNVICDQALLIRNLPNIIWDSSKLVWRALADEELICDDSLTHKLNINPQDIEVSAIPYGARIAYEIAEVCYIRRKALLLNSKSNIMRKVSSSGCRLRNKNSSIDDPGTEYELMPGDQSNSFISKNSQIEMINTQNSCFKQIRLKIIFPNGEEIVRSDLIAWHFRSNSWIITNMMDGNASNQTKNINYFNCPDSNIKQKSLIQSLICAIECCTAIPPKCQVYLHAEEAESIIDSEDLAELLKPFPTGISWYCKKRRFYTSNGLDSNGRGQHFSIALYGSLIAAFNAAIDYRNIFLKNRRKAILPKVEWILCFPVSHSMNISSNEIIKVSDINADKNVVKNLNSCDIYNSFNSYMGGCARNIDRINSEISPLNSCISGDSYHSGSDWLQHPTTVSLLDDQMIEPQNDLEGRILNIDLIE